MTTLQNTPVIVSTTTAETARSVYNFLKDSPVGVLTTVTKSEKPHGVVIYYAVSEDFVFTLVTKKDTTTYRNLQGNNNVMLVVYDAYSQTTVQISAAAEEIIDKHMSEKAFNHTLAVAQQTSDSGVPPITKMWAGGYVAYILKPSHIQMRVFVRPDPSGYDLFSTIDFQ